MRPSVLRNEAGADQRHQVLGRLLRSDLGVVVAPDGEPRSDEAKIDVDGVVELYENYIIPLTKEVEVRGPTHTLASCDDILFDIG